MPWCPKCKMEYQEGVTVCSDCKMDLVDRLEEAVVYVSLVQTEYKNIAEKLSSFLEYSNIKSQVSYEEDYEVYVVSVDRKMEKQAKKLYKAFYYVESDNQLKTAMEELGKKEKDLTDFMAVPSSSGETVSKDDASVDEFLEQSEDINEVDENAPEIAEEEFDENAEDDRNSRAYVMKADQYKDLAGTVWIFLFFGIAGLVFVLLNVFGILSFLNGWLPNTVMGALFLFFLYVAVTTQQKAKKIQSEIDAENKLTEEINQWLEANITQSFLNSIQNKEISDELNYIKATDTMKEMLIKEFGNQNLAYLDRLIDEYYSNFID